MATKIKRPTLAAVPQSKADCAAAIRQLGEVQRQFERDRADMNDQIATITQAFQPILAAQQERINALQAGIQAWCEAHRVELCGPDDKLGKTANLVTGEVAWRQRPPSVTIKSVDVVLETLQRLGLTRFIREKVEINKEAILAEPAEVAHVPGIAISQGEDFVVTPFEAELAAVA